MHESNIPGPGKLALKGLFFGVAAGIADYFAYGEIMRNGFVFPPKALDAVVLTEAGGAILTGISLVYFLNAGIDAVKLISQSARSRRK